MSECSICGKEAPIEITEESFLGKRNTKNYCKQHGIKISQKISREMYGIRRLRKMIRFTDEELSVLEDMLFAVVSEEEVKKNVNIRLKIWEKALKLKQSEEK